MSTARSARRFFFFDRRSKRAGVLIGKQEERDFLLSSSFLVLVVYVVHLVVRMIASGMHGDTSRGGWTMLKTHVQGRVLPQQAPRLASTPSHPRSCRA